MDKLWFVFQDNLVSGPFSREEIDADMNLNRWDAEEAKIWWRGQKSWVNLDKWQEDFDDIIAGLQRKPQKAIWYVEKNGQAEGPLTLNHVIEFLKELDTLDGALLWRDGLEQWTSLFELDEIIGELGISRRQSPRAPIDGKVTISNGNGSFIADTLEVSEGGFAIRNGEVLTVGDTVNVTISSPSLSEPINTQAEVRYIKKDGMAGLQFDNLHIESRSDIISYVRQFSRPKPSDQNKSSESSAA